MLAVEVVAGCRRALGTETGLSLTALSEVSE
jgi:hypothetical protein